MRLPPGPPREGLAGLLFLLVAVLVVTLGWKQPKGIGRWALLFAGAAASLIALASAMAWMGLPSPAIQMATMVGGLLASLGCLVQLPRWLASRSPTEVHLARLVEEVKEYAIFQLDVEGRVATWNQGADLGRHWQDP